MIVTLGGHVDHGKSSLVHALTGAGTDRLAEEQRRGLTIDLGFAYLDSDSGPLGFVDVPGHHRFIHNMVAGVAAHQFALLVVAADDGPMPQSREHLQIMELLGIREGLVCITKADRVDDGRLAAVRDEVDRFTAGTFLAAAPRHVTSTASGAGIDALREALLDRHRQRPPARSGRCFRLAVDRAFTFKGTGVVATGTVHDGTVRVDDELELWPGGQRVRVRGLRVQNRPADAAGIGDRCALNLSGVDLDRIARGCWLGEPLLDGSRRLAVRLQVLGDFPRKVRHWSPVHVYLATSHATGRVALLETSGLEPGVRGLAELVLDTPLPARRGDRLVLRDQSLDRTLGGGELLCNWAPAGRRRDSHHLALLQALAATEPADALHRALALGPVDLSAWQQLWGLPAAELETLVAATPARRQGDELIAEERWRAWRRAVGDAVAGRCRDGTDGVKQNELSGDIPTRYRESLLNELVAAGELERQGALYRPARQQLTLSDAERRLLDSLTPLLDQPQAPSLGDIAKALRQPLAKLQKDSVALAAKGELVRVNDKRLYLPGRLMPLVELTESLSAAGPFTVREFRDASNLGRNLVIEILEFFDGRGFTRRHGDTRTVVAERSRLGDWASRGD